MSLLNPTYLSGGGKKPPKSTSGLPPELGMASSPPDPTASAPPSNQMPAVNTDPTMERDEYGAEMGKDARVWKIYVRETDRADTELVEGWNKSLDVILVFAALFSAVSTAFLIESSQKLQEDPADVTAQTLLAISQALSVLTNATQPTAMQPSDSANDGLFSPSRITVTVNTLWYLSLSLSVATSLLAMLAKDWCHSFLAGRTGHPYTQTIRRQQKWMMIEKWKMQELIMVLPSLIHLSLLLFAIGLCIYVWELNNSVAWPVICVTGLSAGFYVWCSITASVVDYFPYTTVISRFLCLDWRKWVHDRLVNLRSEYSALVSGLHVTCKRITIVCAHGVSNALTIICILMVIILRIIDCLVSTYLAELIGDWGKSLRNWAQQAKAALPIHSPGPLTEEKAITLALHWLVTSCEAPSAIDAALQAISGANAHIYRPPLETCNAALEISKRLVSGNVHRAPDRHVVSLYVRALSFLGSKDNQATVMQTNAHSLGDVQVAVWNLQTQSDEQVAQLIADGSFIPTDQNIEALGIGTSIASHILQHLNGIEMDSTSLAESIFQLLENHETLHPAALQSLMNALALLPLVIMDCSVLVRLIDRLIVFVDKYRAILASSQRGVHFYIYLLCQSLSRHRIDRTSDPSSLPLNVAGEMIECITSSNSSKLAVSELLPTIVSQILDVKAHPHLYPDLAAKSSVQDIVDPDEGVNTQGSSFTHYRAQLIGKHYSNVIRDYFDEVSSNDSRRKDPTIFSQAYLLLAEVIFCTESENRRDNCSYHLRRSPFPRLCLGLVEILEKHDTIPLLEQSATGHSEQLRIHALSLLWVLCALESYAPPDSEVIRNRLAAQLRRCTAWGDPTAMKRAIGYQLRDHWLRLNSSKNWVELTYHEEYLSKVFECVIEAGDHITPSTNEAVGEELMEFKDRLIEHNTHFPSAYRGLASFTAFGGHHTDAQPPPQPHLAVDMTNGGEPDTS
ncbi:putative transmembrane protein [Rhizoctonia solani 123E]|uniref:Putative transmembrane protein n=1 Tax=Rhizoctonia solani 123E TaxID=1423351 RepID=A0A074RLD9_9AGAM|nr:putative transmembrane protein [Rhizoctonia solani 123E]